MRNFTIVAVLGTAFLLWGFIPSHAQKKVAELTLVYDYSVVSADDKPKQADPNQVATHSVYIKGSKSRSEMTNPLFSSTTLFDSNTGLAIILKEVSGQKLLIRLTHENWEERNKLYEGMVFKNSSESREIAGYKCIKATAQTKSGVTLTVFYTKDIIPENKDYDPPFRNLDGLPLEYELANGNLKLKYRISKVNLNPVPASKFDIPKTGYREMNYEESKKMNIGG
ncbi:hypothetical protein ACX0G9_28630 [Flavitalea flava]